MTAQVRTSARADGWRELFAGRNAIFAVILAGGVALHAVNLYIAATVLPSVVSDIGGIEYYAWSTTLFVIASILGSAFTPSLLGAQGPRVGYVVAAAIFTAGALTCAFAPSMPVLLAGRAVQGLGGGLFYALAYAVTRMVFPEPLWPKALGLISAIWGVATLAGPAVGGIFAEAGDWRAAFWSLAPLAIIFAIVAAIMMPPQAPRDRTEQPAPLLQLVILTASVLVLSAASVSTSSAVVASGIVVTLALVAGLLVVETKARRRITPVGGLDPRLPMGAILATVALFMIAMQPEIFIPFLLQTLHGQSPLIAGYIASLMAVGWTLASLATGKWSGDAAVRAIHAAPYIVLAGLVILAITLPADSAGRPWVVPAISLALILVGFGIGMAWPHLVTRIFAASPPNQQTQAAGAITTVQLYASAMGAAAAGMIANASGLVDPGGRSGAAQAAVALCVSFGLAAALAAFTVGRIGNKAASNKETK